MNQDYHDIRTRIAAPPTWFDEAAVPRYCAFRPTEIADIYADEAALLTIRCQGCQQEFPVAYSVGIGARLSAKCRTLAELIVTRAVHYGDPPNVRCCDAGPTMSSEALRVVEYWSRRNAGRDWERNRDLEIEVGDDVVA